MNFGKVLKMLGYVLLIEAAFLLLPMIICLIYGEFDKLISFIIPALGSAGVGSGLCFIKDNEKKMYTKEGFAVVGLAWVLMSLVGALPFYISGEIPGFGNALFEAVSGFTTTGASVVVDVEAMSHGILFWRSLTHFIGGMGIIVFMLAVLSQNEGMAIHIYRAETTGSNSSKLVSKLRHTAIILYIIYAGITLIVAIALMIAGMTPFEAICHAFSVAGTGGFSTRNGSLSVFNDAIQIIIIVAMFLFSINFTLFYLLLIGRIKEVFKNEELRVYLAIVFISILAVSICVIGKYESYWEGLKFSAFQVLSVSSTTGFFATEFTEIWPTFALTILFVLMFIGAMAGSTGGGMKVSRATILFKANLTTLKRIIRPNSIYTVKFQGKKLLNDEMRSVRGYLVLYFIIFLLSLLLVSLFGGTTEGFSTLETNATSVITALGNVGPAFGNVGYSGGMAAYSVGSKLVLCFDMLIGRLEIFPIVALFIPATWVNR